MNKQFKINKLKYRDWCSTHRMPQSGCQNKVSCIIELLNQIGVNSLKILSLQEELTMHKLTSATNFAPQDDRGENSFYPLPRRFLIAIRCRIPRPLGTSDWILDSCRSSDSAGQIVSAAYSETGRAIDGKTSFSPDVVSAGAKIPIVPVEKSPPLAW